MEEAAPEPEAQPQLMPMPLPGVKSFIYKKIPKQLKNPRFYNKTQFLHCFVFPRWR